MKIIIHTPHQLGHVLLSARKARHVTQSQAAAQIGVQQPRLSALETTSTASISLEQMLALFSLYGLEFCVQTREPTQSDTARSDATRPEW